MRTGWNRNRKGPLPLVSTLTLTAASLLIGLVRSSRRTSEADPNGYIAYCPCMGRFGNQADQFLGALAFSKGLNRTLVLPPWIEYPNHKTGSSQVPFNTYFETSHLSLYHRVILMEEFMEEFAPTIWPTEKRISFCYVERGKGKGCDAKEGNPFGPFWNNFNIDFVDSEIFGPRLHYYIDEADDVSWNKYSAQRWPVLAFVGPPSVFPVEKKNTPLQQYLVWNGGILSKASEFISSLPKGPFIGMHLRNGRDWIRACELVDGSRELFSSPQCTGYRHEKGQLTLEMCLPSTQIIVNQIKRGIKRIEATSVFVASDSTHLLEELGPALKNLNVSVHKLPYDSPHVDLAVLGKSNLFIGNCVSSFSAFVKRERDVAGFLSEFWAFPPSPNQKAGSHSQRHQEL